MPCMGRLSPSLLWETQLTTDHFGVQAGTGTKVIVRTSSVVVHASMQGHTTDLDVDDVMNAGAVPVTIPEGQAFADTPTVDDVFDALEAGSGTIEAGDNGLGVLSEVDEDQDG